MGHLNKPSFTPVGCKLEGGHARAAAHVLELHYEPIFLPFLPSFTEHSGAN